jgi:hypothetical protein
MMVLTVSPPSAPATERRLPSVAGGAEARLPRRRAPSPVKAPPTARRDPGANREMPEDLLGCYFLG